MYLHLQDEEEYKATMCPDCDERRKEEGENHCKFCMRNYMKGGRVINIQRPLHRSLDLMDLRGQYE